MKLGDPIAVNSENYEETQWLLKLRDHLILEKIVKDDYVMNMHFFRQWYSHELPMHVIATRFVIKKFVDHVHGIETMSVNSPLDTSTLIMTGRGNGKSALYTPVRPNSIIFHFDWWNKYGAYLFSCKELRFDLIDLIECEGRRYRYFVDGNQKGRPFDYKFIRSL